MLSATLSIMRNLIAQHILIMKLYLFSAFSRRSECELILRNTNYSHYSLNSSFANDNLFNVVIKTETIHIAEINQWTVSRGNFNENHSIILKYIKSKWECDAIYINNYFSPDENEAGDGSEKVHAS